MRLSILATGVIATMALAAGCGGQTETEVERKSPVEEGAAKLGSVAPMVEGKASDPEGRTADVAPTAEPAAAKAPKAFDERPAVGTKATCPVMMGEFVVSETTDHSEYEGKHYAFCCPGCKPRFDADPKKFIDD